MEPNELRGNTFATSIGGLVIGATTTLTISADMTYCIQGKAYLDGAGTNQATPTTDYLTGAAFLPIAANKASVFVVCLNSSGAIKVVQGSIVSLDGAADGNDATYLNGPPAFPATIPADVCPIGYILTRCGASTVASWTFGTSNLATITYVKHTLVNCFVLPSRPQIA